MNNINPNYYYDRIEELIYNENGEFSFDANQRKIVFIGIFDVFKELIDKLSDKNKALSSTFYSKLNLVINSLNLSKELVNSFFQFKLYSERIAKFPNHNITKDNVRLALFLTTYFINHISEKEIPDNINILINDFQFKLSFFGFDEGLIETEKYLRLIVREKKNYDETKEIKKAELICYSEIYGECSVILSGIWADIYEYSAEGSVFNIIYPHMKDNKIIATNNSFVVFEPDILIDTTELTSCFLHNGFAPELYFLNLFEDKIASKSLIIGNLVNFLFDEIIQNDTTDYDDLFKKGISIRPLSIMTLEDFEVSLNNIDISLKQHYENLKSNKKLFKGDIFSIEPSFMSPEFGLQGRLDLMIEHKNNKKRIDLIELKSGKAPNPDLFISLGDIRIQTGVWVNHHVQALCYNMLLDSVISDRTGTSNIYYSSTNKYPLRNAPDNITFRSYIITVRNSIVKSLLEISNGSYKVLSRINAELSERVPSYLKTKIKKFTGILSDLSNQEKNYFRLFISFVAREIIAAQTGDNSFTRSFGASSLWHLSKESKKKSYLIVTDLVPDLPESDFSKLHIIFRRQENDDISVFRKGDICLLYPGQKEGDEILKSQLIKCVIQDIDENKILVSLRNKITDYSIFFKNDNWSLEQDYNLINSKKLFNSIFQILTTDKEKRDILLGNRPSGTIEVEIPDSINGLNEQQKSIFNNAVRAKDYYLIQGPPGTGKTSFMLKNIVKYYLDNSNKEILLAAYTNRAVDEICNVIKSIGNNLLLRLGSKQSSDHYDIMISYLSEEISLEQLYKRIKSTRIIVSTVSSLIQNPDIFQIKKFDIAIIDEASQILEPQIIGILSSVSKFILIGDEKQLPAIVTQPDKMIVKNQELLNIMLENPRNSYFERMIKICLREDYSHSFGMLEYQARMHKEVMDFTARYFYGGKLKIFDNKRQLSAYNIFANSNYFKMLSNNRVNFINTAPEKNPKVNTKEAKIIADLVEDIIRLKDGVITDNTIGIISPFRAQCAEIKKLLPPEYKSLIDVETVERFQGSEREIIIYSFAVNYEEQIANLSNTIQIGTQIIDRKLNVAMTRARDYLIILGSRKILSNNNIYDLLIHNIENNNALINFWELKSRNS